MNITKSSLNNLIYQVNGAAIEIHKALGPGLLESVYAECMAHELKLRKINFLTEMHVPINYKGLESSAQLRYDFFIEDMLVVELKAVQEVLPIHEAQILSYMKLLGVPKGLLINFHVTNIFHEGQRTFVNQLYYDIPD